MPLPASKKKLFEQLRARAGDDDTGEAAALGAEQEFFNKLLWELLTRFEALPDAISLTKLHEEVGVIRQKASKRFAFGLDPDRLSFSEIYKKLTQTMVVSIMSTGYGDKTFKTQGMVVAQVESRRLSQAEKEWLIEAHDAEHSSDIERITWVIDRIGVGQNLNQMDMDTWLLREYELLVWLQCIEKLSKAGFKCRLPRRYWFRWLCYRHLKHGSTVLDRVMGKAVHAD